MSGRPQGMTSRQYFHLMALSEGPRAAGRDDLHQSVFETLGKKQMCEARQGMRGPITWTITHAGTQALASIPHGRQR